MPLPSLRNTQSLHPGPKNHQVGRCSTNLAPGHELTDFIDLSLVWENYEEKRMKKKKERKAVTLMGSRREDLELGTGVKSLPPQIEGQLNYKTLGLLGPLPSPTAALALSKPQQKQCLQVMGSRICRGWSGDTLEILVCLGLSWFTSVQPLALPKRRQIPATTVYRQADTAGYRFYRLLCCSPQIKTSIFV